MKWRSAPINAVAALVLAVLAGTSGCEVYDEPAPAAAKSSAAEPVNETAQYAPPATDMEAEPLNAAAPTVSEYAAALAQSESPGALVPINRGAAPMAPVQTPATPDRLTFVNDISEGMAIAQRQRRPLMLFFTAEWCHYCKEMAAEAFHNPQVVAIGQRFVCVVVDADAAPQLCQQLRIRAFPTVQFLSPSGVPLNRAVGKKTGTELALEMRAALRATAERQKTPSALRR